MQKVEDYLDQSDKLQMERLEEMRRLILDQMKTTIKKRGEKRGPGETEQNTQSKPRVLSPQKIEN